MQRGSDKPVFKGLRPAKPYESLPCNPFVFNTGTATFELPFFQRGCLGIQEWSSIPSHLRECRFSGLGRQERAEKRTMRETEVQIANSGLIEICFEDDPSFRVRS